MHIILGREAADTFKDRFIVLSLDRIKSPDVEEIIETFCVVPADKVPLPELPELEKLKTMHEAMMTEYQRQNWEFVEEALNHLHGKFNGQVDSFYDILKERISKLKDNAPTDDWDGVYHQQQAV